MTRLILPGFLGFVLFGLLVGNAQEPASEKEFSFRRGQAVFVYAVRGWPEINGEIQNQLRSQMRGAAARSTPVVPLNSPERMGQATLYRQLDDRPTLDRTSSELNFYARPDPELKARVETLLGKQKSFRLVDGPEQADFVLLVHGEYVHLFQSQLQGNGRVFVLGGTGEAGDQGTALAAVKAGAIPAPIFQVLRQRRLNPDEAARWRGKQLGKVSQPMVFTEASVEDLIRQFLKETVK